MITNIQGLSVEEILDRIDVGAEIPKEEPLRQYYYMKVLRNFAKGFEEKEGRRPRYTVITYGCQMNAKDSEKLKGILEVAGYESTEDEKNTDLILYNTCTVRENANLKVYGQLGYVGTIKKKRPDMLIGLCGCMMQEESVVQKIHKSYPFVDLIFGTHNIFKLAQLLVEVLESGKQVTDIWDGTKDIVEALPSEQEYAFKDGINIMYGCNNFCSYCIVPYVRGRERSRLPEEIIDEITRRVQNKTKEIMLLGQNVNSYGKTLESPISFAQLLEKIEHIDGLERIRFMTPHPKDLSDDLIEVMAKSKKIMPHLHLPLQSGSSRILKKMNRHYTKEDYLELVEKIKNKIPNISLTTDIMVGFPEESEEDFLDTLDVVDKVGYDSAFTFIYSKRTGTPAATNPNQISDEIVKDRFQRLLRLVQTRGRQRIERFTNQEVED